MSDVYLAIFMAALFSTAIYLIREQNKRILMTNDEAVQKMNDINAKLGQIGRETQMLLDKVEALRAAAGSNPGEIGPELSAAISALAQQAQSIDDLVPDGQ